LGVLWWLVGGGPVPQTPNPKPQIPNPQSPIPFDLLEKNNKDYLIKNILKKKLLIIL